MTDPLGVKGGVFRVLRGGSWLSDAAVCRTTDRNSGTPADRNTLLGFRLALSPSIETAAEPGQADASGGTEGASAEQRPEMP